MQIAFYSLDDVRVKYAALQRERAQMSLKWLQVIYPKIVGLQVAAGGALYAAFLNSAMLGAGEIVSVATSVSVAFFTLILVCWPITLMPVSKARQPTIEEAEMLIIARLYKDAVSIGIEREKILELLEYHRRSLRRGDDKLDC